ncbi:MAG: hypothetical protein MJ002_03550 [Paludibacteraceae bacterium]|nr:hypothetical protein [Paludibacteraceae bacterium]
MRKNLIIILLLTAFFTNAQNALKNDSAFQAQVAAERLQDSTSLDYIKSLYIDALRYKELSKTTGDRELLLKTLSKLESSIRLQESLDIPAPSYYAAASFQLALFYLGSQNHIAAYYYINQAHHYDEDNTEYLEYLVYMNENSDNPKLHKQAIKDLEKLRKLNPYNSDYCLHLINSYCDNDQFSKASRELNTYRKLEGESMVYLQYQIAILFRSGKDKLIEQAVADYIESNPQDKQSAEIMLANYYNQVFQEDKAFALIYRNLDYITNFNLDRVLNPYIGTFFERGDTLSAYLLLDTIQLLHPSDLSVYQYSINVYEATKDTAAIIKTLKRICQLDQQNEDAYVSLFEIYNTLQINDSAHIIAVQGHKLFKNDDWALRHIISLATDTPLSDSLLTVCRQTIAIAQDQNVKAIAYLFIGDYMLQHDSLKASFAAYDSCLTYQPQNSYALNNYSYTLATSPDVTPEDLARAEKMAASAMKFDPSSPSVLDTYAWILFLRGDAISARMYYERLTRICADGKAEFDATTCYHVYCVYNKLGEESIADLFLEQARKLYKEAPSSVHEQEIIDFLK